MEQNGGCAQPRCEEVGGDVAELQALCARMRAASLREPPPPLRERRVRLDALRGAIAARREEIADKIDADFGGRSRHETLLAEVWLTLSSIAHARSHLRAWMRPERRPVNWPFRPARARVIPGPKGVVGIIAPWNYPFSLAMIPFASAIAAGNRVILKPSEFAPRTAALIARIVGEALPPECAAVVTGGADVGAALSRLPLDHLLFTGSARVGAEILREASANLTPVTLELGGKSPAILAEGFPLDVFARRVAAGKLFNAGQTCVAPDYVLAPEDAVAPLVAALRASIARLYPSLRRNPDYTAIINDAHIARLKAYLADARERGAEVIIIDPAGEGPLDDVRKLAPALLCNAPPEARVMQEEIFGPLLPIVGYRGLDAAIAYVNARPAPLALYCFDRDARRVEDILARTRSGTVCVNDTVLQAAQDALPFGGIGPSGMGAYHGREGFMTFSHARAVLYQHRWPLAALLRPPYGAMFERVLRLLIGRPRDKETPCGK